MGAAATAQYMTKQRRATDMAGGLGACRRCCGCSAIVSSGLGAFLVIRGEATAGIIIASSILTSRALAPVELAIANWKGFSLHARAGGGSPSLLFAGAGGADGAAAARGPAFGGERQRGAAGAPDFVVQDVSFALKAVRRSA